MISGLTKLLCVIGNPVEHSLSPFIHNRFAADSGEAYCYLAFTVTPETLPGFLDAARLLPIRGFNVTMPLKEAIIPRLDALGPTALACRSVNTVVNDGGRLVGHSTDGLGLVAALQTVFLNCGGKSALVLGAGGAARAACLALSDAGVRVTALSRRDSPPALPGAETRHWRELPFLAGEADILINASPLGMSGCADFESLAFLDAMKAGALVFDLVYYPVSTRLLQVAGRRELRTLGGLALLTNQAAASWRLFTGADAPDIAAVAEALARQRPV